MQLMVMLATCMFHQYTSALPLSVQEYWISFKDPARCRGFIFSTSDLTFFFLMETLET